MAIAGRFLYALLQKKKLTILHSSALWAEINFSIGAYEFERGKVDRIIMRATN